jgi:hypothetical protein
MYAETIQQYMRNIDRTLIIFGGIITLAGVIFSLQSKSVFGPTSSFMYNNPEWTLNGSIIIIIGLIAMIGGGLMFMAGRNQVKLT